MLIDCIAAMPCAAGRRRRADITNVEKAKNTPPTAADAIAVATVSTTSGVLIGIAARSRAGTARQRTRA